MPTILEIKDNEITETPLVLFECELASGETERWSTHAVTFGGRDYEARVLRHNAFEIRSSSEDGIDSSARISLVLANADSHFSEIERNVGWKGARLTARFLFFNLKTGQAATEARVLFFGVGNAPDEIAESTFRIVFDNRLSLQRVGLPEARIQKRCPWLFPGDAGQRALAITGGNRGKYGAFYRCGYSAGTDGGCGNLLSGQPYTSCDRSRAQCEQRGMFSRDEASRATACFGGVEYVPPTIAVRGYGEKGYHSSGVLDNVARYNDFVPIIYGTAWYKPPIVFARNDGNLTHLEVLLGMGEIQGVARVVANDIEIPPGRAGGNMTATGWYNVVSPGRRNGAFNLDFADSQGQPQGDPYGSMAVMSLVLPNRISSGSSLPRVEVLIDGMKLDQWDEDGTYLAAGFTSNPAWIILDMLRRSGWSTDDIDLASFARTAAYCDRPVTVADLQGNQVRVPQYRSNLVIQKRRSAADLIRAVRNAAALYLTVGQGGLLQLRAEGTLAEQQPTKPEGSNATETLNDGWPAYEFGDGTGGFSGILCRWDGSADLRVWSRSNADSPNRLSVEFQDEFNGYEQDSLSVADSADALKTGQEVASSFSALGFPNVYQAARMTRLQLDKSLGGNSYVEFGTSVRGVALKPGDLITLTYLKEGWQRKPFRIVKVAPGTNCEVMTITAQAHDDAWYELGTDASNAGAGGQPGAGIGLPNPLLGTILRPGPEGAPEGAPGTDFGIQEKSSQSSDGSERISLSVSFVAPRAPEPSRAGIPLVSLRTEVEDTGGTLAGGQTLYYALSAVDADGAETSLSFLARAEIPAGPDSSSVTLSDLHFSPGTASFRVYRGGDPFRLLRIASGLPPAGEFVDTGFTPELAGPVDPNYDHANFYWRLELLPEYTANIHSPTTVGHPDLEMIQNEYTGKTVRITEGPGAGQERTIGGNTADTITVAPQWDVEPDGTSHFAVAEPSWNLGATTRTSPVEFEAPNRGGTTVHVTGRSANAHERECSAELSPLTRWQISGGAGSLVDNDVPPAPVFGIALAGKGTVEVGGIGFSDLANTHSVSSATLALAGWDELNGPCTLSLSAEVSASDEFLGFAAACGSAAGDLLQMDREVVEVLEVDQDGYRVQVSRGSHGSTAGGHPQGTLVYALSKKIYVLPFPRGFFGSPASGSYSYPAPIPQVRIAAAEMYATNSRGDSPTTGQSYTQTVDSGLRTGAGGQFSLQVDGWLAVEDDAVPELVVEETTAVRDVFAVVREAPAGAPIEVHLKKNGDLYCTLTIPAGATISNAVSGFDMAPLEQGARLTIDVTAVPQAADQTPGQDLTVTIRL